MAGGLRIRPAGGSGQGHDRRIEHRRRGVERGSPPAAPRVIAAHPEALPRGGLVEVAVGCLEVRCLVPPPCNATSRLPPAVRALAVRACRLRPVAASLMISMAA